MKKQILKFLFFLFIFCLSPSFFLFAQNPQKVKDENSSWRLFDKANLAYEQGKYGDAFRLTNSAIASRKQESQWALYVLEQALKPTVIQNAGDLISDVRPLLIERESEDALEIIEDAIIAHSIEYYENSIQKIKDYYAEKEYFPEADYLTGKIYFNEGEYELAEQFYLKAWELSSFLDIPEQSYDILYSLSDLANIRQDYDSYEKCLLQIITDSEKESKTYINSLDRAMKQSLKNNISLDKFFLLYRLDAYKAIQASIKLTDFYKKNGQDSDAYTMSINASLSAFTRIYEVITERDRDFVYENFTDFLLKINLYPDIIDWCREFNIWKSFYLFAEYSELNGNIVFAKELYSSLAENCSDEYWKILSSKKL